MRNVRISPAFVNGTPARAGAPGHKDHESPFSSDVQETTPMPKRMVRFVIRFLPLVFFFRGLAPAQQPLLSPRDSVEITIGGKKVSVNYGRPSMRGRKIMGDLVPYSRWWRTGANEATSFKTETDLIMGDSLIPKGSYTIYTLPSETRWRIIINRQTGQWGTEYEPADDLVRLPLEKKTLDSLVEKFEIQLKPTGPKSGRMTLTWEKTQLWIDFRVANGNPASTKPN